MKGFIIAGGLGTRMRPLSERRPKHLLPIANRLFIEYQIDCLARAGVTEIILCTRDLPANADEVVDRLRASGTTLIYSIEETPLDTAGALRNAISLADDEPFFAVNGDSLFDFDLGAAYQAHCAASAMVTLCSLHLDSTGPFGVVEFDEHRRVRAFREPTPEQKRGEAPPVTTPGEINAGAYIVNPEAIWRVPEGVRYSLERGLFPELAAEGVFYCTPVSGYWQDVGRPVDVAAATWAILEGKLQRIVAGEEIRPGVWVVDGARIASSATLQPPVHIGPGVSVGEDAVVGPYVCLGADTQVDAGATIRRSVLFEGCRIGLRALVDGVIADSGTRFSDGVSAVGPAVYAEDTIVKNGEP